MYAPNTKLVVQVGGRGQTGLTDVADDLPLLDARAYTQSATIPGKVRIKRRVTVAVT